MSSVRRAASRMNLSRSSDVSAQKRINIFRNGVLETGYLTSIRKKYEIHSVVGCAGMEEIGDLQKR
jgi:hypothetical protein